MTQPTARAASQDNHEVLLKNDQVRLLDTRLRPGERTTVHAHEWPSALYVLEWSDFIRRAPDGAVLLDSRTLAERPAPGSTLWGAPLVPHSVENIGQTDLRIVAIEIKQA